VSFRGEENSSGKAAVAFPRSISYQRMSPPPRREPRPAIRLRTGEGRAEFPPCLAAWTRLSRDAGFLSAVPAKSARRRRRRKWSTSLQWPASSVWFAWAGLFTGVAKENLA